MADDAAAQTPDPSAGALAVAVGGGSATDSAHRAPAPRGPHPNHHRPGRRGGYSHGNHQYGGGGGGGELSGEVDGQWGADGLPDEVVRKITRQVEYYFSDANLATTDHLMKFINKDPEGFVPLSVVAAFKKVRELVHDKFLLASALRTSTKLVVAEDGKKVRRQQPITEADVEEIQSRIVVAENLPDDHSYHNLMRIFTSAGSVKTIRTCYPLPHDVNHTGNNQAANKASRMETLFGNKLHAFIEYGTVEEAEKAVAELNEGSWRNRLRVRGLLSCVQQGPGRGKSAHEGEEAADEDDQAVSHQLKENQNEDFHSPEPHVEHQSDEHYNGRGSGHTRGWVRGRGARGRGQGQHNSSHDGGHPIGTPPLSRLNHSDQPKAYVPRMPDGTRGFTMGRGKPLSPAETTD